MTYGYSTELIKQNKEAVKSNMGVRLGKVCIKNKISVITISKKLGVSRQTIYNWFAGITSPQNVVLPSVKELIVQYTQSTK
jgi:hypothetical protein